MAGLHGQDGPGRGQVGRAHDVGRRAQVGADADALEDGGGHDEVCDICDAEVVRASGHGRRAGLGQGGGQEGHVRRLVGGDLLQVGVEGGVEAAGGEVGLGEVLQALLVEGVFEVLEGEGVVEDVGVRDGWGGLTDLLDERATVGVLGEVFVRKSTTRVADSRLGNGTGSGDGSECCNDECGLHSFGYTIEGAGVGEREGIVKRVDCMKLLVGRDGRALEVKRKEEGRQSRDERILGKMRATLDSTKAASRCKRASKQHSKV